jgi:hypothetical protein
MAAGTNLFSSSLARVNADILPATSRIFIRLRLTQEEAERIGL